MTDQVITLGDKVKDRISGFTGIVTTIAHYLNGCARAGVQTSELHEGKPIDTEFFDLAQLEILESGAFYKENSKSTDYGAKAPGGPQPSPKRHEDPPSNRE